MLIPGRAYSALARVAGLSQERPFPGCGAFESPATSLAGLRFLRTTELALLQPLAVKVKFAV